MSMGNESFFYITGMHNTSFVTCSMNGVLLG